jgi:hypothetical protein
VSRQLPSFLTAALYAVCCRISILLKILSSCLVLRTVCIVGMSALVLFETKLYRKALLAHLCFTLCLSVRDNSRSTKRSSMKFGSGVILKLVTLFSFG